MEYFEKTGKDLWLNKDEIEWMRQVSEENSIDEAVEEIKEYLKNGGLLN